MYWIWLLSILPKRELSRLTGYLVSLKWPDFLSRPLLAWFARRYQIDLSEAELSIEQYRSIAELFTRRLKPGLRPIGPEPVHPADSRVTAGGRIHEAQLLQVKNWTYEVRKFLQVQDLGSLEGGSYFTYYLCPTDYHRVHSPVSGRIAWAQHIPGTLWPVNDLTVESLPQLFLRNERVVIAIETLKGLVYVVMVGATNVGKMSLSFDQGLVSYNWRGQIRQYSKSVPITAGEELGIFHMGSTVVVLYPSSYGELPLCLGSRIKVGQSLVRV